MFNLVGIQAHGLAHQAIATFGGAFIQRDVHGGLPIDVKSTNVLLLIFYNRSHVLATLHSARCSSGPGTSWLFIDPPSLV
ncbi:hypothetical protein D3C86_2010440 [compost metagenome]